MAQADGLDDDTMTARVAVAVFLSLSVATYVHV
jgi:hypothetical protein